MAIHISSSFDAGAIEVISLERPDDIRLNIRKDNASDFLQWFYYRVSGCAGQQLKMRLLNASQAAYEKGWPDYQAVASYDRQHWFRVPSSYDGKALLIEHEPQVNVVYYAYFEPYSHERHLDLLASAASNGWVRQEPLGATIDGRDLDLLVIGNEAPNQPKVWVIARQHPGESMAEWFIEGMLQRLLDHADPVARRLLSQATFYVVPNMNPDGSVRGNLRTNAAGANLNREWLEPSAERSPEVLLVRRKMEEVGVDLFLDIHGDESIPYVFLAGTEGVPSYSGQIAVLQGTFKAQFLMASPDFQTEHGYDKDAPGEANLTMATNFVGERFRCLAFTLEMPFKDNLDLVDKTTGWNGERSKKLGAAVLQPILAVLPNLR
jgi:murein tripeptide amidase MpaA